LYDAIRTALLSGNCSGTLFSQLEAISGADDSNCGKFEPIITANSVVNPEPKVTVSAYPNPYTDRVVFTIKSNVSGIATFDLYSMLGQKVKTLYHGFIEKGVSKTLIYEVPPANRKTMVYKFKVDKENVTGTVIKPN
jgi:hypothetical protein